MMRSNLESPRAVRLRSRVVLVMAVVILAFSMYGFVGKLIEFFHVLGGEGDTLFVITPILNYLLATIGFLMLLFWAMGHGMFHNIEQPKFNLLENETKLDEQQDNQKPLHFPRWIAKS